MHARALIILEFLVTNEYNHNISVTYLYKQLFSAREPNNPSIIKVRKLKRCVMFVKAVRMNDNVPVGLLMG